MIKHFTLFCALSLSLFTLAQERIIPCHTDEYSEELLDQYPEMHAAKAEYLDFISHLNEEESQKHHKTTPKYIIPVVFHIIHTYGPENISRAQIMDQMRILNEDFRRLNEDRSNTRSIFSGVAADCEIEFRLAKKDPQGNCTDGINRVYSPLTHGEDDQVKGIPGTRWDYRKYLNIWVVANITRGADDGGRVLGYATLPYNTNSNADGIVMLSDYVGSIGTSTVGRAGRVLTHEVGHWLGLLHPFQNGCGGSNCRTSGDRICDTPPVAEPSFGCNTSLNTCNNDSPNQPDQIENFMDYANGSCMNMFTEGQKTVMHGVLNDNRFRASNVSASNLIATGVDTDPTCAPVADFYTSDERTICVGQSIKFEDWSFNGDVAEYEWTFQGGNPSFSTFAEPEVTYNTAGKYPVSLKVSNAGGSDSKTVTEFITVLPATSPYAAPLTEGFDDDQYLSDGYRLENDGTYGWRISNGVSLTGARSLQAFINENTPNAERYMMYLPPVNLAAFRNLEPKLNFMTAYRQRSSEASEILIVSASDNCGESWRILNSFSANRNLASSPDPSPNWFPSSADDWLEQSISLASFRESENLWLRFEIMSRQGNSLYVDNINIDQFTLNVSEVASRSVDWHLAPNPAGESGSRLMLNLNKPSVTSLTIYDPAGKKISDIRTSALLHAGEHEFLLKGLSKGLYFVSLKVEEQQEVKKLIIH